MATVTVSNLPDKVHRALRVLAATHGRSTEAEISEILEADGYIAVTVAEHDFIIASRHVAPSRSRVSSSSTRGRQCNESAWQECGAGFYFRNVTELVMFD